MGTNTNPSIEFLTTARIGEKGQLTMPKEYRDALGLKAGASLTVLKVGDGLILMPEQPRFQEICDSVSFALQEAGITKEALEATLPEARRRVFARRYPKLAGKDSPKKKVRHR